MKIIYGLYCPIAKEIKYVGCSSNICRRYESHLSNHEANKYKKKWIEELKVMGLKPVLLTLQIISDSFFEFEEKWIKFAIREGHDLTNIVHGNKKKKKGYNWIIRYIRPKGFIDTPTLLKKLNISRDTLVSLAKRKGLTVKRVDGHPYYSIRQINKLKEQK